MKSNAVVVSLLCLPGTYALSPTQFGSEDYFSHLASQDGGGIQIMAKDAFDDLKNWPSRGSQEDRIRRSSQQVLHGGAVDSFMEWPARGSSEDRKHRGGQQASPDDTASDNLDWPARGSAEDRAHRHQLGADHNDATGTFEPDWNNPHINILDSLKDHASKFIKFFGPRPIDVHGKHEFMPPNFEAGDQRGPCPGLNALANHNYIPRNGVVNSFQVIFALYRVYGVGLDLGALLSALSTCRPPLDSLLLGEPRGITAGHNFLEADSSNTRADVYESGKVGDNFRLRLSRWIEWYNMSPDPVGNYNLLLMSKRGVKAFEDSKRDNPFFWRGPVSGLFNANGVLALPPALMSNHSGGINPIGHLTKDIIKSFYGIYGDEPNFEYREGWERIPNNWYRRPTDYTLAQWLLEGQAVAAAHPTLFSLGGNIGRVNTFTGLDLSDIFGGAFNSVNLLRGNASICVALEVLKTITPSPFSSLYSNFVVPLKLIEEAINPVFKVMNCPVFEDLSKGGTTVWDAIRGRFPGARMGPFPY
ncbi:hypothetical protein XA68_17454 [Ophiocordyceps unilateralis]|uniref:Heme haloperoxidase family profile domain-containing protein n=1 Tax=Ophiocordyceps unilateralis TaxID=268505 RepID=A0A2A9PKG7_OPHUN|nr:hypothetical protein XA68_17454 [Ophiocordyceps unilateralis]